MTSRHPAIITLSIIGALSACQSASGGRSGALNPAVTAGSSATCKVYDYGLLQEYSGDCVNGKAHGKGIAKGRAGQYVGRFENGSKSGYGVFTWNDGNIYEGNYKNNTMNGKGVFKLPDGTKYEGDFFNGRFHGVGTLSFPRGVQITDKFEGKGIWEKDNYIVIGKWNNGKLIDEDIDASCKPENVCKAFDLKIGFSTKPQAPTEVSGSFMGFPVEGVTANTTNSLSYDVTPSNLSVLTAKSYKIALNARIELEEHTSARMGWLPIPVVIETKKIDKAVEIHVKKANGFRDKGQVPLAELKAYRAGLGVTTTIASAKPSVSIVSITEDP